MTDQKRTREERLAELREKFPRISDGWWQHTADLWEQYPEVGVGYWFRDAEIEDLRVQFQALRSALIEAVGYYSHQGSIPVDVVRKILAGGESE